MARGSLRKKLPPQKLARLLGKPGATAPDLVKTAMQLLTAWSTGNCGASSPTATAISLGARSPPLQSSLLPTNPTVAPAVSTPDGDPSVGPVAGGDKVSPLATVGAFARPAAALAFAA